MIVFLGTWTHRYTTKAYHGTGRFGYRFCDYQRAFHRPSLRRATYIFTDLDRLNFWELELAARLYRQLAGAGARVLNDPARLRLRYSLLRTLNDAEINSFNVWRVEDTQRPDRFPVFLRTESAHRGPCSDLLHDAGQVDRAVRDALAQGLPRRELMLVEYRAEPVRENLFRKLGMYRVGEHLVPALCAHEPGWMAKYGVSGIAGQTLYDEEYEIIRSNPHADALWPAFRAAGIEYGRADFGLVDGRVEVYEINSNPAIARLTKHAYPIRFEADKLVFEKLVSALEAVDTPAGPRIKLDDAVLARQRYYDRRTPLARWLPHARWLP